MKQEKAINDPKADQFQLDYFYDMILPYSIDHIEKNGYTRVWVKDDYTIRSLEFAEGRFNREGFEHIPDFCQLNPDERGEM
ncbi:MAG TPA: hypothetical protein PLA79_13345, partial [Bacteroidales bacterium]|nr:hypothetical protein [Bacteroidales bacterium]